MHDVTQLLQQVRDGDRRASDELLPIVYEELRKLASHRMAQESPAQTLQATALVHEAYLRLVGSTDGDTWDDRGHFFASAAEAMRRILVEAARRKGRVKHGGEQRRQEFEEAEIAAPIKSEEILTIHEALEKLESSNPEAAQLVKLRYFAGFTINDAAKVLSISPRKVNQVWAYSKAWLLEEMSNDT